MFIWLNCIDFDKYKVQSYRIEGKYNGYNLLKTNIYIYTHTQVVNTELSAMFMW